MASEAVINMWVFVKTCQGLHKIKIKIKRHSSSKYENSVIYSCCIKPLYCCCFCLLLSWRRKERDYKNFQKHSIYQINFTWWTNHSFRSHLIKWVHRQQNHPRNIQSFSDFIGYSSFSRGTATTQTCINMISSFNHSGLLFKLKSTIKPKLSQYWKYLIWMIFFCSAWIQYVSSDSYQ